MNNLHIPAPPGEDVATQPHPLPKPNEPSPPFVPPDVIQPAKAPAENPALTRPVAPPTPEPVPPGPPETYAG